MDSMHDEAAVAGEMSRLTDLVDAVITAADRDEVSVEELVRSVGRASFTPMILLPALAVATPLSGIPLLSSVMGLTIALVSGQLLLRRRHVWLPAWVMRRSVKGKRVRQAFERILPAVRWIDARSRRRWRLFAHRPLVYVPQLVCFLSGLAMPFFEFVPFSSTMLGIGVALLAVGMLTRDGLITLVGLMPYGVVPWLIWRVV